MTETILIEAWRKHYNSVRPHSSFGYKPPVPKVLTDVSPEDMPHFMAMPLRSLYPQIQY